MTGRSHSDGDKSDERAIQNTYAVMGLRTVLPSIRIVLKHFLSTRTFLDLGIKYSVIKIT